MLKLASWRQEKGITQQELADRIGVTTVTISLWESGKAIPRLDLAVKCCKELGCNVEDVTEFNF